MSDVNFPDVLGAITGGPRASLDILQAAAAVRPRPPRSGQVFEILLLLQNASDERLAAAVTLALPETDAQRQRGRFVCANPAAQIVLQAAEVGVVIFSVLTLPDAAPSAAYRARLTLDVKTAQKPQRVRGNNGGGAFDPRDLLASAAPAFEALTTLQFNASKARGGGFDLEFALAAGDGKPAAAREYKTRFVSLWRATSDPHAGPMLQLYSPLLRARLLSQLRRGALLPALTDSTRTRFEKAGYPLREAEAVLIAKLMTLLLEYSVPDDTNHGFIAAGRWAVTPLLNRPYDPDNSPEIPRWVRGLLRTVEQEPRAAGSVAAVLAGPAYDDLLYDAVQFGFDLVQASTGEDVGNPAERDAYAADLISLLNSGGPLDFSRAYLPLIMGGMLINDLLLLPEEKPADQLHGVAAAVEAREKTLPPEEAPLLELTNILLDRTARKYGFWVLP